MTEAVHSLRNDAISWTPTDTGSVVILDLRTSTYLTLNDSAAALWQQLAEGAEEQALVGVLVDRYGLTQERAAGDLAAFLADLRTRDMLAE